jgi:excisionase family DNA binding protein
MNSEYKVVTEQRTGHEVTASSLIADLARILIVNNKEVLNFEETMFLTGYKSDELYKKTRERTIPHYKSGKRLYFKREEVLDWMLRNKVNTKEEINALATKYMFNHKIKNHD